MYSTAKISLCLAVLINYSAAVPAGDTETCPTGFTLVQHGPPDNLVSSCYKLVSENLKHGSAERACMTADIRAHLIIIGDAEEQAAMSTFIEGLAQETTVCKTYSADGSTFGRGFLTAGVRDLGQTEPTFVWHYKDAECSCEREIPMTYTNFIERQPDNAAPGENCLQVTIGVQPPHLYEWNDVQCSAKSCAVCEIDIE